MLPVDRQFVRHGRGSRLIIDGLLLVIFTVLAAGLSLFPVRVVPAFMQEGGALDTGIDQVVSWLGPVSAWVPFDAVAVVFPAVTACVVFSLSVRAIRVGMSLVSGGGGA